ncbi:hypothetical protein P389DRAFT_19301 [Cystobasidium minutum MCA 4210]|uniref:uncharacterized protein n=1 Tax=Cystobasidium minutum MCA 4210 TaxID=1397322 RepID=UPI0034CFC703|eukprot:jgi/Rhomi1/19301/CE19300_137
MKFNTVAATAAVATSVANGQTGAQKPAAKKTVPKWQGHQPASGATTSINPRAPQHILGGGAPAVCPTNASASTAMHKSDVTPQTQPPATYSPHASLAPNAAVPHRFSAGGVEQYGRQPDLRLH